MCGICGTIGFNRECVSAMNRALAHRGPDDSGIWQTGEVCFGHTRLSIIDTSPAGHQPMSNEDGTVWITYNGEIYNYRALRKELEIKGHAFRSSTDTEVIIHLYEEFSERCVDHLRGMFAFAVWDTKNKRLFAARDRLGIKPFFYSSVNEKFIFASELKAIAKSNAVARALDVTAVNEYFSYGAVPAPLTLMRDIRQLLPGHYLCLHDKTLVTRMYWDPDALAARDGAGSAADHKDEIAQALEDAVKVRMISDVPLGAFLSGGVDSSAIVSLMQKNSARPIKTFSVGFKEKMFDEREFSSKVAAVFGTDHTQIILSEHDVLKEIPAIFDCMDQPSIDGFNTFVLSKAVREKGIKVALSGLGGDELFAGYPLFRRIKKILPFLNTATRAPRRLKQGLFNALYPFARTRRDLKLLSLLFCCDGLRQAQALARKVFLDHEIESILAQRPGTAVKAAGVAHTSRDPINEISYLELTTYLRHTLLQDTDRMSMAHALEVRVPFLDHLLVEKLFTVPGDIKIEGAHSKQLLIDAMAGALPREIYARPKMGFVFPFDVWLKGGLRDYCADTLSEQNIKKIPVLNRAGACSVWNDFLRGSRRYNYSSVLSLLSFVRWHENYQG